MDQKYLFQIIPFLSLFSIADKIKKKIKKSIWFFKFIKNKKIFDKSSPFPYIHNRTIPKEV